MKKNVRMEAEEFIGSMVDIFEEAYRTHAGGESEESMMIVHDILAANAGASKALISGRRKIIQSAIQACDRGVPLPAARTAIACVLHKQLEEILHGKS